MKRNLPIDDLTEVDENDLNAIDYLNGESQVSQKGNTYLLNDLKGALAKYNGSFSLFDEINFIKTTKDQIVEFQLEHFNYLNLPEELDKYRIERKIIENGSVAIIKESEKYFALNYAITSFNVYNEPVKIQIVEPLSSLNGTTFECGTQAIIIRNNLNREPSLLRAHRYISLMEKTLFQLEKNLTSSAPKGLINLKNNEFDEDGENSMTDTMENMINSQNTFFVIKSKSLDEYDLKNDNEDSIFIPMELTDRTDSLISNYSFFKEQLKEVIGAEMNLLNGKKERLITGEVDRQQGISNSVKQHMFNIREVDLNNLNKLFGLNVEIEYQSDDREEVESDDSEESDGEE